MKSLMNKAATEEEKEEIGKRYCDIIGWFGDKYKSKEKLDEEKKIKWEEDKIKRVAKIK